MNDHRLHTVTQSAEHIWMLTYFDISIHRKYRCIKIAERNICQYKENELLTRYFCVIEDL